jgi:hypothetical protein
MSKGNPKTKNGIRNKLRIVGIDIYKIKLRKKVMGMLRNVVI